MKPVTKAELALLTSTDVRTVERAIGAAGLREIGKYRRAILYNSTDALRAMYRSGESAKDRLDTARAEIAELDLAARRRELLPRAAIVIEWQRAYTAFRARILAIPSKIAGKFAPPGKLTQAEAAITAAIHEALAELSGDGTGDQPT